MKKIEPLLPHQMEAFRFAWRAYMDGRPGALLQHIMRSRKTSTVLTLLNRMYMARGRRRILVVCPPKVVPVWRGMMRHYAVGGDIWVISSGALSQKVLKLPEDMASPDIVVIDEIHQFRAYSQRYKTLKKLCDKAQFRIGLSGTLVDKDMDELFYPMQLIGPDFWGTRSRDAFRKAYCRKVNPNFEHSPWEMLPEHKKAVMGELRDWMHTYNDEEAIRPPEHEKVTYTLTSEQEEWIHNLENRRVIEEIKDIQADLSPAHVHNKIIQIEAGFFLHDNIVVKEFDTAKYAVLRVLMRAKVRGRALVWYRHTEGRIRALEALEGAREFTPRNLEWWRATDDAVLVCHPRSAGAGIDFSAADTSIFLTPNPSTIDLMQAFYRLAKVGSDRPKKIYHLIADTPRGHGQYDRIWEKMEAIAKMYQEGVDSESDKISPIG